MRFGVTFYPDQHPKEIWDREFSEIKKTGFELVRFAEMAWDWIEPREGDWQFEGLDQALNLCKKYDLKVVLGVPVSQAPQWLIKKYPEMLHVAHDGQIHPEYGPRPNACRNNPDFKQYAETLTRVLAERYSNHPALEMWQIDNEPCYPPLDLTHNKDYCHCESTKRDFVEWAKNKYRSIEKLNEAWGTKFWTGTFSSFDEITTPKAGLWDAGNPHIYLDWFRFKSESLSTWLNDLKKIIRESDKKHKIGTNSFTSLPNRIGDHTVLAKGMDWFGWDIYPKGTQNTSESLAQIADYWRSVCEGTGADFVVSELQGGPNVRWGYGGYVKGEEIKEWVRILSDHGAKVILFHNWRPPLFGNETGGFGILKADGTPTERLEAIKETISQFMEPETKRLGSINIGNREVHSQVPNIAIYYSKASELETYQEEGPYRPCPPLWFSGRGELGMFFEANSVAGAYKLLWPEEAPVSFIFDEQLESAKLPYKVILLANPYLLSKKQVDNLTEFIRSGGIVVSESRFGLKDQNAHLYEKPLLENILGATHLYSEIIDDKVKLLKIKAFAYGFRDVLEVNDARIILKFDDGNPALIEKKMGDGKIIYAAFSLFSSLLKPENEKLIERIQDEIRIL